MNTRHTTGLKSHGFSTEHSAHNTSTSAAIQQFVQYIPLDVDMETARQLQLRDRGITCLPTQLGLLLRGVRKLDLTKNNLTGISALSQLPHLSNLSLSDNPQLGSLEELKCPKLAVLVVANCGLHSIKGIEESKKTLRTLIANDNALVLRSPSQGDGNSSSGQRVSPMSVANYMALASLEVCETVVLSRNPNLCGDYLTNVLEIDDGQERAVADDETKGTAASREAAAEAHPLSVFAKLPRLKKLSLSECCLQSLPARWFLPLLTELRLTHNALTSLQPDGVILRSLKVLDISHNQLNSIATLRRCRFLQKLNLRENPVVSTYVARDREEGGAPSGDETAFSVPISLQRSVTRLLRHVEYIDGKPILPVEQLARRRPRTHSVEQTEGHTAKEEGTKERPRKSRKDASVENADKREQDAVDVVDRAMIAAEADQQDVVMDTPNTIAHGVVHAPIVRRERRRQVRLGSGPASGHAAVAKLLQQKQMPSGCSLYTDRMQDLRLQYATREELQHHVVLQRELIQRLQLRVMQLEEALTEKLAHHMRSVQNESRQACLRSNRTSNRRLETHANCASRPVSQMGSGNFESKSSPYPRDALAVTNKLPPSVAPAIMPTLPRTPGSPRSTPSGAPLANEMSNQPAYAGEVPAPPPMAISEGLEGVGRVLAAHAAGRPRLPADVVAELLYIREQLLEESQYTNNQHDGSVPRPSSLQGQYDVSPIQSQRGSLPGSTFSLSGYTDFPSPPLQKRLRAGEPHDAAAHDPAHAMRATSASSSRLVGPGHSRNGVLAVPPFPQAADPHTGPCSYSASANSCLLPPSSLLGDSPGPRVGVDMGELTHNNFVQYPR